MGPVPESVPCKGPVTIRNVSGSPSASEPVKLTGVEVSSLVVTDCELATGISLTGVTVIKIVAMLESTVPSLALKVKLSAPKKLGFGV